MTAGPPFPRLGAPPPGPTEHEARAVLDRTAPRWGGWAWVCAFGFVIVASMVAVASGSGLRPVTKVYGVVALALALVGLVVGGRARARVALRSISTSLEPATVTDVRTYDGPATVSLVLTDGRQVDVGVPVVPFDLARGAGVWCTAVKDGRLTRIVYRSRVAGLLIAEPLDAAHVTWNPHWRDEA